ncbi:MAG: hypothetical protein LUG50_16200 [Planctomycetaceae bacterium]|nr:hypothetical protein [Planctomycetaceae bacterium]
MSTINNNLGSMTLLNYYVKSKSSTAGVTQASQLYSTLAQDTVELSLASMSSRVRNIAAYGFNPNSGLTNDTQTDWKKEGGGVEALLNDSAGILSKMRLPSYSGTTISEQDFKLTKTTPEKTDEELEELIRQLAKKHAAGGEALGTDDPDFVLVGTEYISSVSPDRKGIIDKSIYGLGYISSAPKQDLAKAYDENGNHIATYTEGSGWRNVLTQDERDRNEKLLEIYFEAYDAEVADLEAQAAAEKAAADEANKASESESDADSGTDEDSASEEKEKVDVTA